MSGRVGNYSYDKATMELFRIKEYINNIKITFCSWSLAITMVFVCGLESCIVFRVASKHGFHTSFYRRDRFCKQTTLYTILF